MGSYTPKDWRNATTHEGGGDTSTPISAAAIEDLETRVTDYADSLTVLNAITDGYATGDGSTDDTVGLQAAFDDVGSNGGILFIPNGSSFYKLTDTLTVPDVRGFRVIGESLNSTELRMTVNNKPIIQTSGQYQRGLSLEELRLSYTTQQTNASHPNSWAVAWTGPNGTATYYCTFKRLYIEKATVGLGILQAGGNSLSFWGNVIEEIQMASVAHQLINLVGQVAAGQPVNILRGIRHLDEYAAAAPTGTALYLNGEAYLEGIDIEDWTGRVLQWDSGLGVLNGLHLERHDMTTYVPVMECSNGVYEFNGCAMEMTLAAGITGYIWKTGTGGYIRIGAESISTLSKGGGAALVHHTSYGNGRFVASYPREQTGTELDYFVDPSTEGRRDTRVDTAFSGTAGVESVAAAATVTLPDYGELIHMTGGAATTTLTASWAERPVTLRFSGAGTMTDGTATLRLAGDFAYTAGDTLSLRCDGTAWWETGRSVN